MKKLEKMDIELDDMQMQTPLTDLLEEYVEIASSRGISVKDTVDPDTFLSFLEGRVIYHQREVDDMMVKLEDEEGYDNLFLDFLKWRVAHTQELQRWMMDDAEMRVELMNQIHDILKKEGE